MNVLNVYTILYSGFVVVWAKKYDRKDGKLLLDPVELIDLITEEKIKTSLPTLSYKPNRFIEETGNVMLDMEDNETTG